MSASDPTREEVASALFNLLNTKVGPAATPAGPFKTVRRGLVIPTQTRDFVQIEQPFLCVWKAAGASEDTQQPGRGLPAKRVWWYFLAIFCTVNQQDGNAQIWETVFDPLMDAIEAALLPDKLPENLLTLGGLVDNCLIQGEAHINSGDLVPEGQGSALIPIRIVVP